MTAMDAPLPPLGQRGIVSSRHAADPCGSGHPAIEFLCDCATVTVACFDKVHSRTAGGEVSYTCDGCRTVHWLTITPREGAGGD